MLQQNLTHILSDKTKDNPKAMLLNLLSEHGGQTISELCQSMGYSTPFVTKLIKELMEAGLVRDTGKRDNYAKRAPRIYDLVPDAGYFLGLSHGSNTMDVAICDMCGNEVYRASDSSFVYSDTQMCFGKFVEFILTEIEKSGIEKSRILQACVNVGGRVNPAEGKAFSVFTCLELPLAEALSQGLGIETIIDNDSRSMAYGEHLKGCCKGVDDVIFVNLSWGLGIAIFMGGKLCLGKSGFSGEFGHMHLYANDILCHCGKAGCLETEVSGRAWQRKVKEALAAGKPSILSEKLAAMDGDIEQTDLIEAVRKEDVLAIGILQDIARELGKNLAGIINIFNPEMLVIGGELSVVSDYLMQPVEMGIKKYSLNLVSADSQIVPSALKNKAGIIGACLMARHKYLNF